MSIYENVSNKKKHGRKVNGRTYNITIIPAVNYSRLPNVLL